MSFDVGVAARRSVVVAVALLGLAAAQRSARADEEMPSFACDARAMLSVPSGARLLVHRPGPEQLRRLAAARPQRFGPFDRRAYGFEWVLFYVDLPDPPSAGVNRQPMDVLLRLEGPRSPWFRLVGSELRPTLPQLVVYRNQAEPGDVVRLATPDARLPLFFVGADTFDTRSNVSQLYLIDMRPERPRIPVLLECVEMLAWGACGTWDANYASVRSSLSCAWQADPGDFRCRETLGIDTPWGGRSAVREFLLLSPPEADEVREARVSSELGKLVQAVATDASVQREVETIGPVQLVSTIPRAGGGRLVLLGAAGNLSSFGARLFLGVVETDGSVRIIRVNESKLSPSFWTLPEYDGAPIPVPGTVTAGDLSFRAAPLAAAEGGPTILRVRVRETTPPSEPPRELPEAVYWVGIHDLGAEVVACALRLATNTAEYTRCAEARTAPNAVAARIVSGAPFAADFELEPPHFVPLFAEGITFVDAGDGDAPPPECPVRIGVTWNAGFQVSEPKAPSACPGAPPRRVRIDDDGEIHASASPKTRQGPQP